MKIKSPKTRESRILNAFRETCSLENLVLNSDVEVMRQLGGSLQAHTLAVVPPPTLDEYKEGVPFTNKPARMLREIWRRELNINTGDNTFLFTSCSLFGPKMKQLSVEPVRKFVDRCVCEQLFKRYVCIGSKAYQALFSNLRVSQAVPFNMVVYPAQLNRVSLFVVPDPGGLLVPENLPENSREYWIASRLAQSRFKEILKGLPLFRNFLGI